jgi:DNA-binding transcriptional ArsR family regulator
MSLDRDQADRMVEQLKTLAQPQRLMILSTLLSGERAVGEIEAATGIGQPALSQQLAELRRADLVATRREARQIFYSVASEVVEDRIHALFAALGADVAKRTVPTAVVPLAPDRVFTGAATFARIG